MAPKRISHTLLVLAGMTAAAPGAAQTPLQRYTAAVADAKVAEEAEIASDLVAVTRDNDSLVWNADRSRVLVVTWKAEGFYRSFLSGFDATSDNEGYVVWVTLAPHVQQHCRRFMAAIPSPFSGRSEPGRCRDRRRPMRNPARPREASPS